MAQRAYWKGNLRLSLVSCPIELFSATSEREKISFNQLNSKTGNRIKYKKVDARTGDEVESADIVKAYQFEKDNYVTLEPDELEAVALDSTRSIEIVQFVPDAEIDELYYNSTYYIGRPRAITLRRPSRSSARRWAKRAWSASAASCSARAST